MLVAMMLAACRARRLVERAERTSINMAGNRMGRAIAPSALPASGQMTGGAVHVITGRAPPSAGWTKRLLINTTDKRIGNAGGPSTGSATGQPGWAGQAITHVARQGMLATQRVVVACTKN